MKKLIIRGYYGRDNLGDELMKDIFIRAFNKPNIRLMIMNSSPEDLKREYGINTPEELITGKIPGIKNTIKRVFTIISADVYVYGGGTIITDKHSYYHLIENTAYFLLRRLLGRKSLLISVGATQFKTKIGLFFARKLIGFSTKAYIRDEDSYNYLMTVAKKSKKLVLAADMVLLVNDFLPIIHEYSTQRLIGLCLMPYYFATYHDGNSDEVLLTKIVEQIKLINKDLHGYSFLLIPIQSGKNDSTDQEFCEKVYYQLRNVVDIQLSEAISNTEKIAELVKCEAIISMRLHALMIAKLLGRRIFAINHNEKIQYFMKRYDTIENTVNLEDIDSLSEHFLNLRLIEKNENLQHDYFLAKKNLSVISKCLGMEDNRG